MILRELTIENFGRYGYRSLHFSNFLNFIVGEDTRAVFAALSVVLCNRLLRFQVSPYCVTEKSRIVAQVESDGAEYVSETLFCADTADHSETNIYCGGRRLSEEECRALLQVSPEEEECSYFINRYDYARYVPFVEPEFSCKLARYRKDMEEDRQDFAARTDGTGLTRTFRMELKKFCGEFLPQQIRLEKRLWLVMDEEGRFSEKDGQIDGNLSRTEEILFEYLCFLQVNRFWGMVQKTMGRTVKKPLFIDALADGIDEGPTFRLSWNKLCLWTDRRLYLQKTKTWKDGWRGLTRKRNAA